MGFLCYSQYISRGEARHVARVIVKSESGTAEAEILYRDEEESEPYYACSCGAEGSDRFNLLDTIMAAAVHVDRPHRGDQ